MLQRLGFVVEDHAREGYRRYFGCEWQDHVLTALTNDRWTLPGSGAL